MERKIFPFLKWEYLFLALIILIGSYVRLSGIFCNSFFYTYDVGRDLLAVGNILETHRVSLIGPTSGLEGVFYGPWWYLIILPMFIVTGGSPQGVLALMALLGILTIYFAFLFGKKTGSNFLALAFASLISVSPSLVGLSFQMWSPNIAPFFITLVLLTIYKIYSEKKPRLVYFFLLGLLLALIPDLGIVFGFVFFVSTVIAVAVNAYKKISLKAIGLFILGAFIIFSPRVLFEFRHQFLMSNAFLRFLTTKDGSQSFELLETFINRLNFMYGEFIATFSLHSQILSIFLILFLVLSLVLYYKKAEEITRKIINTALIILFTFLIVITFFNHAIYPHYLVGLPTVYILLVALALYLFAKNIKNYYVSVIILLSLLYVMLNPVSWITKISHPLPLSKDTADYGGQLAVIDYVYQEAKGKNFKFVAYTPPVHDYTYQYLFKWRGETKYRYLPSSQSDLAYFILEPDREKPIRLTNWLNLRKGDGRMIKTEKFPNGIIVETRIR